MSFERAGVRQPPDARSEPALLSLISSSLVRSTFYILHSSFFILHSTFYILHSTIYFQKEGFLKMCPFSRHWRLWQVNISPTDEDHPRWRIHWWRTSRYQTWCLQVTLTLNEISMNTSDTYDHLIHAPHTPQTTLICHPPTPNQHPHISSPPCLQEPDWCHDHPYPPGWKVGNHNHTTHISSSISYPQAWIISENGWKLREC